MARSFWLVPLWILAIVTPLTLWLDPVITQFFYTVGNDPVDHFVSLPILDALFTYGPLLATSVATAAALVLIGGYLFKKLRPWRAVCLVLLLTYAVGVGLLVNGLKDYWGRPRPKQVEAFGGTQPFRPYFMPNPSPPVPSRSFPCGHCAMGFFFWVFIPIGKRLKNRRIERLGWILGTVLGLLLSITRLAQGGHFFSDALLSALIIWYTALFMDWLVAASEW